MGIELKNNFNPPITLALKAYKLEALAPNHNQRDYDAWMSSRDSLKGIFGPRNPWPGVVTSLSQNLEDLEMHYREFMEGVAYTYSIVSLDDKCCLGCLYIRPSKSEQFECRVDFWFRDSHKDLEAPFFKWLKNWLITDWGFEHACYPGRSISWEDFYKACD